MKRPAITVLFAAAAAAATPAAAQTLGSNLIVNGGAEAAAGGSGEVVPVPGFVTTAGQFTVVRYDAGGGYPDGPGPGGTAGGFNFFAGGSETPSIGVQRIAIGTLVSLIDGGAVTFNLSALLGGYASQGDYATLGLSFLSATKGLLGSTVLGPVTPGDRGDATGFLARSTTGFVPAGTRAIDVALGLYRTNGSANDGYADNLSLILGSSAVAGAVPEPASWGLFILGFGALGAVLRRRRRLTPRTS